MCKNLWSSEVIFIIFLIFFFRCYLWWCVQDTRCVKSVSLNGSSWYNIRFWQTHNKMEALTMQKWSLGILDGYLSWLRCRKNNWLPFFKTVQNSFAPHDSLRNYFTDLWSHRVVYVYTPAVWCINIYPNWLEQIITKNIDFLNSCRLN